MVGLILEIILIITCCFIVDLFTYKYIRYLDKKERDKLAKKESEYLKKLIADMNGGKKNAV